MDRSSLIDSLRDARAAGVEQFAAPPEDWVKEYAPGKWTVAEVLAHVADVQWLYWWRFCQSVGSPGCRHELMDQDAWAVALEYGNRPVPLAASQFLAGVDLMLHLVETLPQEVLRRTATHPERGEVPAWSWAQRCGAHAMHHFEQVAAAREGRLWTPKH